MSVRVQRAKSKIREESLNGEVGGRYSLKDVSTLLNKVISSYSEDFVGREKEVRMIILSLIGREHIYMISPPGTGKTMMRRVAESFGFKFFYHLMNYDVKLEDIVAIPKVKKIKKGGEEIIDLDYELRDPGLATAEVAYLDELFKANTAVLNAILGVINERTLAIGNKEVKVPLWTVVGASNEVPQDTSLQAFMDRFLFRDFIKYLGKDLWYNYLLKYWAIHQPDYKPVKVTVPKEAILWANQKVPKIDVYGVLDEYLKVLDKLQEKGVEISDRRKGRILKAIASSAILNGRDYADISDLEVLLYTIPKDESECEVVAKAVDDILGGYMKLREELARNAEQLRSMKQRLRQMTLDQLRSVVDTLANVESRIAQIDTPSLSSHVDKMRREVEEIRNMLPDVLAEKLIEATVHV